MRGWKGVAIHLLIYTCRALHPRCARYCVLGAIVAVNQADKRSAPMELMCSARDRTQTYM